MKFLDFCNYLEKLEATASRNEVTLQLVEMFKKLDPDDIKPAMYLLQGSLAPQFANIRFNFSRKLIFKALSVSINNEKLIKDLFAKFGDVGLVAEEVVKNHDITVSDLGAFDIDAGKKISNDMTAIYSALKNIAISEGKGSQDNKMQSYLALMSKMQPVEVRYASRVIVGELRLGISEKTILDSLSWFVTGDKSLRKKLDLAFGYRADVGELSTVVLTSKNVEKDLLNIKLTPGIPVASKLVERAGSPDEVWERMPECFVQPKLDGLRGQLHLTAKGDVFVFSRNMENMTEHFPDLVADLKKLGVKSIILDSEIIGYDAKTGKYLTYQETMQRRRKYDVEEYAKSIPVRSMCFDVLYLDGKDLTQTPIEERLELLKKVLKIKGSGDEVENAKKSDDGIGSLHMLETTQMQNIEELTTYFEDKVLNGLEGIITKEKESVYEPGTRNFKWIKLKANSRSDLVDTIDVVVMGYYVGRGQRAKFGIGALLTGVYDSETDKYYSLGKVGTGIKDEMFETIIKELKPLKVEEMPENYEVQKMLHPDVWVKPEIIAEIDADEITRSPSHTAAVGKKSKVPKDDPEKGLSIRFPRLKIWNRDKKLPNSVDEIVRMYELRKGK